MKVENKRFNQNHHKAEQENTLLSEAFDACRKNDLDTLKLILKVPGLADLSTNWGDTILMQAAKTGKLDFVTAVLDTKPTDINAETEVGMTAVLFAMRPESHLSQSLNDNEQASIVRELLSSGARIKNNPISKKTLVDSRSILDEDILQNLLGSGTSLESLAEVVALNDMQSLFPSMIAGGQNLSESLSRIGGGADIQAYLQFNPTSEDLSRALLAAIGRSNLPTSRVSELLDSGADPDILLPNMRSTPLCSAVFQSNFSAADCLLRKRANPESCADDRITPLMYATGLPVRVIGSVQKFARLGIQVKGMRIPFSSKGMRTIVTHSDFYSSKDPHLSERVNLIETLIQYGADLNRSDASGETALSYATGNGNNEVLRTLAKYSPNPNTIDDSGITPLMRALFGAGCVERIRILLDLGADPEPDKHRETYLLIAAANRNMKHQHPRISRMTKRSLALLGVKG